MPRNTLAKILAGHVVDLSDNAMPPPETLLAQAASEGVLALLGQRVSQLRNAPSEFIDELLAAGRLLAASSLLLEAECRRALATLPPQKQVLMLKGSALAHWLYPQPFLRECSDIDLLMSSRADVEHAAEQLGGIGYAMHHRPDDLAHELLCRRELANGMRVDLDMHWRLVNAPVFADVFGFDELYAAAIPLPRLGATARGLCPVHAFAHAVMHRAINLYTGIGDRLKWLYDLHLLAESFDANDWESLVRLCGQRGISGVCIEGIDATEALFGQVAPVSVLECLDGARARDRVDARRMGAWGYMQRRNLASLPSGRVRLRWLWQSLFPPTGYLQELYGSERGRMWLLMERGRRACQRLVPW